MRNRVQQRFMLVAAAFVLGGFLLPAAAVSIRCDNVVLREGSHMHEVSASCGTPRAEFSRVEYLQPFVFVYVDEWIYQFGANKFERLLRFENGRLRRIEVLDKPAADRLPRFERQRQRVPPAQHRITEF